MAPELLEPLSSSEFLEAREYFDGTRDVGEPASLPDLAGVVRDVYLRAQVMEAFGVEFPEAIPADGPFPGWVYLIADDEGLGRVKIGYSLNPIQRLATLQAHSPARLRLVSAWRAEHYDESQLHKALDKHRLHGEWFGECVTDAVEAFFFDRERFAV